MIEHIKHSKILGCFLKHVKEDDDKEEAIISANLEDPEVATRLDKVNPHPNSQEG